jgi:RimJ/RimL family protein N-acetyltransferase
MIIRPETADDRSYVVSYIAEKVRTTPQALVGEFPFEVLAAVDSKHELVGAVLYNNFRGPSIETHWAGDGNWLSRSNLHGIFAYPFAQLGVRRVTGIIHRKNKHARKVAEKIGFKLEGVCRHGFKDGDACIYGLIKSECRWLKESVS